MSRNILYCKDAVADISSVEEKDNKTYFNGDISSLKTNSRGFRYDKNALARMVEQAASSDGVGVYFQHRTYSSFPSGRSTAAKLTLDDKVNVDFYIQQGIESTKSDEVIELLNAGTVNALSTGTTGGKLICDQCSEEMRMKSDGWFSYGYQCENGHKLGKKDRKGNVATAELQGPINLEEFSVVGRGANYDAKVIKKLQQQLSDGEIDADDLSVIASINNINLSEFHQTLGYEPSASFFIPQGGNDTVNNPNPELQAIENKRLSDENAALQSEIDELKKKLENAGDEDFVSLNKELEEAKQKLREDTKELEDKVKESEYLAEQGKLAIELLRKDYKIAYNASCGTNTPTDAELESLDKALQANTNVAELHAGINRLWSEARKSRSGGQRYNTPTPTPTTQRRPDNYTPLEGL